MLIKSYKELEFWKRSKGVSLLIVGLSRKLPNERICWVILDQILRSGFSVGANIAEGFGRFKGKEYKRYLRVALDSARETEYWLELLKDCYPRFSGEIDTIISKNTETIKMLSSTIKTLDKNK